MIKEVNTLKETGQVLRVSPQTVHNLINASDLETFKIGRRRFVSGCALRKFIKKREAEAA